VPINKQYPLEQLMEACRSFISHKKKRIMFEYVMLKVRSTFCALEP
jgi:adenine C2-methylase RlmN of 23S rRNA A2503 and tRNA A37